jgi:hypothetical protein
MKHYGESLWALNQLYQWECVLGCPIFSLHMRTEKGDHRNEVWRRAPIGTKYILFIGAIQFITQNIRLHIDIIELSHTLQQRCGRTYIRMRTAGYEAICLTVSITRSIALRTLLNLVIWTNCKIRSISGLSRVNPLSLRKINNKKLGSLQFDRI